MIRYQYKLRLLVYKSLLVHTPDYIIFGFADISRRRANSICTACFVVRRPRLAVDTSTNRRHGFLCRRIASMEHAADTAEAAAVDHYFPSSTENIFIPLCVYRHRVYRLMISLCSLPLSSKTFDSFFPSNNWLNRMTTTTPQCRNCKQRRVHAIPPCPTLPTPSGDETEKKNRKG